MAGLTAQPYLAAVRQRLGAYGFIDGRNLYLEIRYDAVPREVRELIALKPDALFACTTILARALHAEAGPVPLVFAWVADPVHAGLVQSYARPGGNVTGVANRFYELAQKRVDILRELLPSVRRVAVAAAVFDPTLQIAMRHAEMAAARVEIELFRAQAGVAWTRALEQALAEGAQAFLILTPFSLFGMRYFAEEVVQFSIERRVPILFSDLESVALGGLLSYGGSPLSEVEQAAELLARVLKGERPADMPVELAARFELAVNLKTARAIGIQIPQSILLRADRIIE